MKSLRLTALVLFLALTSPLAFSQAVSQPSQKPKEPLFPGFVPTPQCATHKTFVSSTLNREMAYCILLPSDYTTSQRTYPVLYLLHGLWGSENDWLAKTAIADYVRNLPLIVVMPEGDDSWYTNSAETPENRYEDYLFNDVVQQIESNYRVRKTRDSRFIAGLSMGGFGALKGAMKYPQLFSAIGSFSGAFNTVTDPESRWISPKLAFGALNNPSRRANDMFVLMSKADPAQLPYIFATCGERDPYAISNEELTAMMRRLGITYEYHEVPGIHQWPVWDYSVRLFLRTLVDRKLLTASAQQ